MGYTNWKVDYKTKEPVLNNGGDYRVISSEKGTKNIAGIQVEGYNLLIENLLNNKQTPLNFHSI